MSTISHRKNSAAQYRVRGSDLAVGKPAPYSIFDTYDRLMLRSGSIVKSDQQRKTLIQTGRVRPESTGEAVPVPTAAPSGRFGAGDDDAGDFDPFQEFHRCATLLKQAFTHLTKGPDGLDKRMDVIIARLGNLIDTDPDAALGAAHIDRDFPSRIVHPIRQAILCDVVARAASLSPTSRCGLVGAALTANIGMLDLQAVLDHQAGPLSEDQREGIREHPERSADLLLRGGISDELWLRAVRQHHERFDGSGYPAGLEGDAIGDEAAILMLADTYMAMVTPRAHKEARAIRDALRELLANAGRKYHEQLTGRFIKEIGVFPPGTYVGLSNKEVGVVVQRGSDGTKPLVYIFIGPDGLPRKGAGHLNLSEGDVEIARVFRKEEIAIPFKPAPAWGY